MREVQREDRVARSVKVGDREFPLCAKCNYTGYITVDGMDAHCECLEKADRALMVQLKSEQIGLPIEFCSVTMADLKFRGKAAQVKIDVEAYCARIDLAVEKGYGMYFHGDRQTGKTTMISIVLQAARVAGYNCCYYTFHDFIRTVREAPQDIDDIKAKFLAIDGLVGATLPREDAGYVSVADSMIKGHVENGGVLVASGSLSLGEAMNLSEGHTLKGRVIEVRLPISYASMREETMRKDLGL